MRIIAGNKKGTKLYTLDGDDITRPTLDRVKEALFSILIPYLKDSKVLDLFSGSGALALESISRGASKAFIADKSYKAIDIINKNITKTKLEEYTYVINKDFEKTIKILSENNEKFNIIFLDPPYDTDYIQKSIKLIIDSELLDKDGIIVAETNDEERIMKQINNLPLNLIKNKKYGKVYILLLKRKG